MTTLRTPALALLGTAAGLLLPAAAQAATLALPVASHLHVDLPSTGIGEPQVAGVGDWNGDGVPDFAVSNPGGGSVGQGTVWVVFGRRATASIDLAQPLPASRGLTITGPFSGSLFGISLASGDVDGDGHRDLVAGAPTFADMGHRSAAWVIRGGTPGGTLDLAGAIGTHGYAILGPAASGADDVFGRHVVVVPDMNGDHRAEVAIGAPSSTAPSAPAASGSVYVTFGRSGSATLDTAPIRTSSSNAGFVIAGPVGSASIGLYGLAAGDVDHDGRGDVVIGAPIPTNSSPGEAYVVFGKSATAAVELAGIPSLGGFLRIRGGATANQAGDEVAVVGDMNGDRRPEVVVCSPDATVDGDLHRGYCNVVFGRKSPGEVELDALGAGGFSILPRATASAFGQHVSSLGDVNGDGRGDLAIGVTFDRGLNGTLAQTDAGNVVVVLGKADAAPLLVGNLGAHGWLVGATVQNAGFGRSLALVGDQRGAGIPQLAAVSLVPGAGHEALDVIGSEARPSATKPVRVTATKTTLRIRVRATVHGALATTVAVRLTAAGRPTVTARLGARSTTGDVTATVHGLVAGTAYVVQATARNAYGARSGAKATLKTA